MDAEVIVSQDAQSRGADSDRRAAWAHLAEASEPGALSGGHLAEVAGTLDRLIESAYLQSASELDATDVLAALLVIRQVRVDLAAGEGYLLKAARALGVTWARLAPALGLRSRQAAERRYLALCGDASDHATGARERINAARDQRAAARAEAAWRTEHSAEIIEVAARLAAVPDLQERANRAELASNERLRRQGKQMSFVPPRWPAELRAALNIQPRDTAALFRLARKATLPLVVDLSDHPGLVTAATDLCRRAEGVRDQAARARLARRYPDELHDV
jgi:hypothetical protein